MFIFPILTVKEESDKLIVNCFKNNNNNNFSNNNNIKIK